MINAISIMLNMDTSLNINKLIYTFKRISFFDKIIPANLYARKERKFYMMLIIVLVKFVFYILVNYLVISAAISVLSDISVSIAIYAILAMFCIIGPLQESQLFRISKVRYICLKYLKLNARNCLLGSTFFKYIVKCISMLVVLILVLHQWNAIYICLLWISYICSHIMSEAFFLFIFSKTNIVICSRWKFLFIVCLMGALLVCLPLVSDIDYIFKYQILIMILALLASSLCLYYILSYKHFELNAAYVLDANQFLEVSINTNDKAKEYNYNVPDTKKHVTIVNEKDSCYKKIDKILRKRYHKYISRMYIIRIVSIGILFISIFSCSLQYPSIIESIFSNIGVVFPILIFLLSIMCVGESYCQFLYKTCDSKLLQYNFYHTTGAIRHHFMIRLKYIAFVNMLVGVAVAIILIFFYSITSVIISMNIILLVISIFPICLFNSVIHLSYYYLYQPYGFRGSPITIQGVIYSMGTLAIYMIFSNINFENSILIVVVIFVLMVFAVYIVRKVFQKANSTFIIH